MKSNEELLRNYENVLTEAVKAANGWNRKSESRLNKEAEKLRTEILSRMESNPKK